MTFDELTEFISLNATIPTIMYLYNMDLDQNKKAVETIHLIQHEDCQNIEDLYNKYERYKKQLATDTADIIEKIYAITKQFDDGLTEDDICVLDSFNIHVKYGQLDLKEIHLRELTESNFSDIMLVKYSFDSSKLCVIVIQNYMKYTLEIPIIYFIDPTLLNNEEYIQSVFRLIKPQLIKSSPPVLNKTIYKT